MEYKSPFKIGTIAHQEFETYVCCFGGLAKTEMIKKYKVFKEESENYLRHGWKTMADFDFKCKCIENIFKQKFNKEINLII